MSQEYFMIIPTEPVGKGRPRFTRSGHAYTPERTRNAEKDIQVRFRNSRIPKIPKGVPVKVEFSFFFHVPLRVSKKEKEKLLKSYPMKKPDIDNTIKLVLDALNGLAWEDDAQVVEIKATKEWTKELLDGEGYTLIKISRKEEKHEQTGTADKTC